MLGTMLIWTKSLLKSHLIIYYLITVLTVKLPGLKKADSILSVHCLKSYADSNDLQPTGLLSRTCVFHQRNTALGLEGNDMYFSNNYDNFHLNADDSLIAIFNMRFCGDVTQLVFYWGKWRVDFKCDMLSVKSP